MDRQISQDNQPVKITDRKPYTRPELIRHGSVESQTQVQPYPSGPIVYA